MKRLFTGNTGYEVVNKFKVNNKCFDINDSIVIEQITENINMLKCKLATMNEFNNEHSNDLCLKIDLFTCITHINTVANMIELLLMNDYNDACL
jgi:hypothetical protein